MKYSKELHERVRQNLRMFDYPRFDDGDIDTLLEEIERLQAERRWIPVSERLPESGFVGLCQVAGNGYVIARYAPYDSEGGWTSDEIGYCFVTHWMPLPPPPEAD